MNEAIHELRRPLQVLALSGSAEPAAGLEHSLRMAAGALERLDREINGGAPRATVERLALAELLLDSVGRCRPVAPADRLVVFRDADLKAEAPLVRGDRFALTQAVDNLLANAIEHGGPRIVVGVASSAGRVRVTVRDCARPLAAPRTAGGRREPLRDRVLGRARHGHGLRLARRVAAAHGGRVLLRRSAGGAEAVLELPLVREEQA